MRVVVYKALLAGFGINNLRGTIWLVTLGVDALIPIVKWKGAGFRIDVAGPGVLARRLIKVAMND